MEARFASFKCVGPGVTPKDHCFLIKPGFRGPPNAKGPKRLSHNVLCKVGFNERYTVLLSVVFVFQSCFRCFNYFGGSVNFSDLKCHNWPACIHVNTLI